MPEQNSSPNKRRSRHDDPSSTAADNESGSRKRRAFLQTMGQQLREFGNEGTSPQDNARTTFGTSPSNLARPASRSTNATTNIVASNNVDTPESDAAPGEDDQLPIGATKSALKWLWRQNEVLPSSDSSNVAPLLFDDLLDWSQSYFDLWHPAFPFLHAPSIIDFFRQLATNGLRSVTSSPHNMLQYIILRSILSISVADRRQMATSSKALHASLVFHSFNDAISSVQLVLTEETSILSLQALVSVQLFLITMHRYNAASRLEGLAVRMLFQLGLHRCPKRIVSPPNKEAELRKRLFWSIYCIDRYICIRLGTPLGIRSDEMDVCFPHDESHDGREDGEDCRDSRLTLLEFLARHACIRGSIMENRNKSAMRDDFNEADQIMEVETEHTRWWNTVDEYLSNDEREPDIVKVHQVTLIVLRFESILALHRSILATSRENIAYNAALQRCISASRSIINTLHKSLKGYGAFDGSPGQNGYESMPLVWPSFTWAVWMSVYIIVFAATEKQVSIDTALRLADRSNQILQHLARRGTNWPEACSVAVKNLTARLRETSTRSSTAAPRLDSRAGTTRSKSNPDMVEEHSQHNRRYQGLNEVRGMEQPRSGQITPRTSMAPPGLSHNFGRTSSYPHQYSGSNLDAFTFPNTALQNNGFDTSSLASAYLGGAGTFLGIAQQSSDNPIPNDEIMHLFNGEDMAYWFNGENNGFGSAT